MERMPLSGESGTQVTKSQIRLVRSLQQKKYRDETGLFVAEGEKCVEELRKAFGLVLLFREGENATRTEIEQMSSLRTPQGVIAVFKKHLNTTLYKGEGDSPFRGDGREVILALDGVQDPGNLGTIIRTCDWFGVHHIVCSHDTADCYNPKVVQATMGALARVQVHYTDLTEWLCNLSMPIHPEEGTKPRIYGTLLDGKDLYEVTAELANSNADQQRNLPTAEQTVIIMGNEGNGIRPETRKYITLPIRIPSYPNNVETSESLNVAIATAIVLAEFRRP